MGDQGAAKSPSNGLASIERDFDNAFVAVKSAPCYCCLLSRS